MNKQESRGIHVKCMSVRMKGKVLVVITLLQIIDVCVNPELGFILESLTFLRCLFNGL